MIPLNTVFWLLVLVFGLIGALRGWTRELLVTFSVIVALFLRWAFTGPIPIVSAFLNSRQPVEQFYIYSGLVVVLAVAGYAGPVASAYLAGKARREKVQDVLLGFVMGCVNGYLIVGTIWHFLHQASYNIWGIVPPQPGSPAFEFASRYLLPVWMSEPLLLTTVALLLVIALIVFL